MSKVLSKDEQISKIEDKIANFKVLEAILQYTSFVGIILAIMGALRINTTSKIFLAILLAVILLTSIGAVIFDRSAERLEKKKQELEKLGE